MFSSLKSWSITVVSKDVVKLPGLIVIIYTSQQKKRYNGSMLNFFYIEKTKKNRQKSYTLDSCGHKK